MPSIELLFNEKQFRKGYSFYFYSINIQDFPKLNEINGQNIALNNYDKEFEEQIPYNPLLQKLNFEILDNEEFKIKPLIFEEQMYNKKKRKFDNIKWKIELYIAQIENYFSIYLKINKVNSLIAEYLNILTVNSNKRELKENGKNLKTESTIEGKYLNSKIEKKNELNFKNINRYEIRSIDSSELNNQQELKKKLLESRVGLENPSSTIYMASILQAFIHSDIFLQKFFDNYNKNGKVTQILYNLFMKISLAKVNSSIPLEEFANSLNKIDKKYNPKKGNNPILFITDFLEYLDQENKNSIKPLFSGVKETKFKKYKEYNQIQDFLIYLISIDENKNVNCFNELLTNKTKIDYENEIDSMEENIIKVPSILIINVDDLDKRGFKIEHRINICKNEFDLYAINSYTDYHSKM